MESQKVDFVELKVSVVDQYSYPNRLFSRLPKTTLPNFPSLFKIFKSKPALYLESRNLKKIKASKIKGDEEKGDKHKKRDQRQKRKKTLKEDQTALEDALEKLLSSKIKGLKQKEKLLTANAQMRRNAGNSDKEALAFGKKASKRKTKKALFQKTRPFSQGKIQSKMHPKTISAVFNLAFKTGEKAGKEFLEDDNSACSKDLKNKISKK